MVHKSNGVRAKKHLGQHFLSDAAVADRIAGSIQTNDTKATVLEIGPGTGALTRPLIERFGKQVKAIDIDAESIQFLHHEQWISSDQIIQADFLQSTTDDLGIAGPVVVAGNFPYNISSQILFKLLEWRHQTPELVGMFQKEVAQRVCAPHGSKVYGILSVLIQHFFSAEYLFTVPPSAFIPPPKVESGIIRLIRKTEIPDLPAYDHLKRVTKAAFNQRRKTLRNALKSANLNVENVDEEMLRLRAEQLSPGQFAELAKRIPST